MKIELEVKDILSFIKGDSNKESVDFGMKDKYCVLRTYSAGVHLGTVFDHSPDYKAVSLKKARRLWKWNGANTLHEVSKDGVTSDESKISEEIPEIIVTEVIEIIPCSQDAIRSFEASKWQ